MFTHNLINIIRKVNHWISYFIGANWSFTYMFIDLVFYKLNLSTSPSNNKTSQISYYSPIIMKHELMIWTAVITIKHVSTFVNKVEDLFEITRNFDLIDKCRYVFYGYDGSEDAIKLRNISLISILKYFKFHLFFF